jgi:Ca2+-transporting ATPase
MVDLVHQLPGRVRFKVAAIRGHHRIAAHLQMTLISVSGISSATASETTGSVLVFFDEPLTTDWIRRRIIKLLSPLSKAECQAQTGRDAKIPAGRGVPHPENLDWHLSTPRNTVRYFSSSAATGLTETEARARLLLQGTNLLPGTTVRPLSRILKSQLTALPTLLIAAAAGLSLLSGALLEGLLALGIALANASIGAVYEARAELSLDVARETVALKARVLRSRRIKEIPFEAVVTGDILDLQIGSRLPADARLIEAHHLSVDESALTGESIPVLKSVAVNPRKKDTPIGQRDNMVYRGTQVVEGSGRCVVVATGNETVLGNLLRYLGSVYPPEALVAREMRHISRHFITLALGVSSLYAFVALLRGQGLLRILRNCLILTGGAIPSGFSTLAISAFAFGQQSLRQNRIVVRRLRALASLASTQVVCFDKTGTLTVNRMGVSDLVAGGRYWQIPTKADRVDGWMASLMQDPDASWLIRLSTLCNEAYILHEGARSVEGSSTEKAFIELAESAGVNTTTFRGSHPILDIVHRTEKQLFMVTRHRWDPMHELTVIKGNPIEVLDSCVAYRKKGECYPLSEAHHKRIEAENFQLAGQGLRVLGLAFRWDTQHTGAETVTRRHEFIWAGLIGLKDPVRRGARKLIQTLNDAQIKTVVITGDQSLTAYHIGKELALGGKEPLRIFDAVDLDTANTASIRSVITRAHVFSRLNPTQKLQIVQAYQNTGLSVVMVGDGFNDVLALKAADVGIAMGKEGAVEARQSADLVLTDDHLASVGKAIATGRAFYGNMRNGMRYLSTATYIDVLSDVSGLNGNDGHGADALQSVWTNLLGLSLTRTQEAPFATDTGAAAGPLIGDDEIQDSMVASTKLIIASVAAAGSALSQNRSIATAGNLFWRSLAVNQLLYARIVRGEISREARPPAGDRLFNGILGTGLIGLLIPLFRSGGSLTAAFFDMISLSVGAWTAHQLLVRGEEKNR